MCFVILVTFCNKSQQQCFVIPAAFSDKTLPVFLIPRSEERRISRFQYPLLIHTYKKTHFVLTFLKYVFSEMKLVQGKGRRDCGWNILKEELFCT